MEGLCAKKGALRRLLRKRGLELDAQGGGVDIDVLDVAHAIHIRTEVAVEQACGDAVAEVVLGPDAVDIHFVVGSGGFRVLELAVFSRDTVGAPCVTDLGVVAFGFVHTCSLLIQMLGGVGHGGAQTAAVTDRGGAHGGAGQLVRRAAGFVVDEGVAEGSIDIELAEGVGVAQGSIHVAALAGAQATIEAVEDGGVEAHAAGSGGGTIVTESEAARSEVGTANGYGGAGAGAELQPAAKGGDVGVHDAAGGGEVVREDVIASDVLIPDEEGAVFVRQADAADALLQGGRAVGGGVGLVGSGVLGDAAALVGGGFHFQQDGGGEAVIQLLLSGKADTGGQVVVVDHGEFVIDTIGIAHESLVDGAVHFNIHRVGCDRKGRAAEGGEREGSDAHGGILSCLCRNSAGEGLLL